MPADDPREQKRTQLFGILEKSKCDAKAQKRKFQEAVSDTQRIEDLAASTQRFFEAIPADSHVTDEQLDQQIEDWSNLNSRLNVVIMDDESLRNLHSGVTMTSMSTASIVMETPAKLRGYWQEAAPAQQQFVDVLSRSVRLETVERELKRLRLDRPERGVRSVGELFGEASRGMTTPSGDRRAPAAVLIPLREALDQVLSRLLRLRPEQERTWGVKGKVISIMQQLGRKANDADAARIASEGHKLINELSLGKQRTMSNSEMETHFRLSLLWADALLTKLDEQKLRPE